MFFILLIGILYSYITMAKISKIVIPMLLVLIIFIPNYVNSQVVYTEKKDKQSEQVDRQEEKRLEQNRRAKDRRRKRLKRMNLKESKERDKSIQSQQKKAQSYSVERNIKSRRVEKQHNRPSAEERLVMKLEKQKAHEDARKAKTTEREYNKALKNYHKKVSGAGKDIANKKKVYKRMKKSKRIANKNNKR